MNTLPRYGLFDYRHGSYMLQWTHDRGKPLMTLEQAQAMLERFPERPDMRIERINEPLFPLIKRSTNINK